VQSTTKRGVTYVQQGEGSPLYLVGDLYTFKVTSGETNGAFALWEAVIPPQAGPPPHIHHREDESFYILEGELQFLEEDRTFVASGGSFVHVPRGTVHRFKNVGTQTSRALMMVTPAGFEKMFEEIGTPATDPSAPPPPPGPEDIEKLLAVAPKYGLEILPFTEQQ
jgi:quercetin dioxygenase-like cupin family protein